MDLENLIFEFERYAPHQHGELVSYWLSGTSNSRIPATNLGETQDPLFWQEQADGFPSLKSLRASYYILKNGNCPVMGSPIFN